MNIRLPHITGQTVPEQLRQVIGYLRQLALELQQQTQSQSQPEKTVQKSTQGNVFTDLRVRRSLQAQGGVNGVYMQSLRVWDTKTFRLQSKFKSWDAAGARQSFLVSGTMQKQPVLGVVRLSGDGTAQWIGTEGVSVQTQEGGVLCICLDITVYDYFIVQSAESFRLL